MVNLQNRPQKKIKLTNAQEINENINSNTTIENKDNENDKDEDDEEDENDEEDEDDEDE